MNIIEKIDQYLEEQEKAITNTRDLVNKNPKLSDAEGGIGDDTKCKTDHQVWFKKSKKLPDAGGKGDINGKPWQDPDELVKKNQNIKP